MDDNGAALARRIEPEIPAVFESLRVGGIQVGGPAEVTAVATKVATELARIIGDRRLFTTIQGRDYVNVEGWTTAAAMLGVLAREVSVEEGENGDYVAVVELVRASDGMVIGRGSALCGGDENPWGKRPRYARRSMAVTRATGKACRLAFSWVVALAGYQPTPAEEMPHDEQGPSARSPVPPAGTTAAKPPPAKLSFSRAAQKWTGLKGEELASACALIAKRNGVANVSTASPAEYVRLAGFCDTQVVMKKDFAVWADEPAETDEAPL